jgi:hypothetical protein
LASQEVSDWTARRIENAKAQGISEADMKAEIGDLSEYVRTQLRAANKAESDRKDN